MFNYSFKPGFKEKICLFREYGFEYIHWCDDWDNNIIYSDEEIITFKQITKDFGIICQDVHGTSTPKYRIDSLDPEDRKGYLRLLKNRIKLCSELGGDCVVFHPPKIENEDSSLKLEIAIESLRSVESICNDLGIRLAIENCYGGDEGLIDQLLSRFDPDFLGICFDSGHANIHGNFEASYINKKRLLATHLHDNKGDSDSHQIPFWGTVNWIKVIDLIVSSSFMKPLNLEVTYYKGISEGSMRDFLGLSQFAAEKLLRMTAILR